MHGMWGGWGANMGGWGWLMMALFWILVIVGLVIAARWILGTNRGGMVGREESALDILKKRYARGELSREEYERMKRELQ